MNKQKIDKTLINYVKDFSINDNNQNQKYEEKRKSKKLDSKKISSNKNTLNKHKNRSAKKISKKISDKFIDSGYYFHEIPKISKLDKQNNKKKDEEKLFTNETLKSNIESSIKVLKSEENSLSSKLKRQKETINKLKKKYNDQINTINELEKIYYELKNNYNTISNIENYGTEILNNINEYDDFYYNDKEQENFAINAVEQQIIDQLCPNPDAMSYEQLLQLEEDAGKVCKGLTKEQIKNLPFDKYNKKKYNEFYQCIICMDEFNEEEKVTLLPCEHIFHMECIEKWLLNEKTCLFCKSEIR